MDSNITINSLGTFWSSLIFEMSNMLHFFSRKMDLIRTVNNSRDQFHFQASHMLNFSNP